MVVRIISDLYFLGTLIELFPLSSVHPLYTFSSWASFLLYRMTTCPLLSPHEAHHIHYSNTNTRTFTRPTISTTQNTSKKPTESPIRPARGIRANPSTIRLPSSTPTPPGAPAGSCPDPLFLSENFSDSKPPQPNSAKSPCQSD